MANNLTGDYEAVIQIAVRQINGILATMHQNAIDPAASPTFPHSTTLRIGDLPPVLAPEIDHFSRWLTSEVQALHDAGAVPVDLQTFLTAKAPPGVAAAFSTSFKDLAAAQSAPVVSGTVRGIADLQLSNPTISVPTGSTSEITVHVHVRADYTPDPGSSALPKPIHGEVQATYTVEPATVNGLKLLRVRVSSSDRQIQFIPKSGTGLSALDAEELAKHVRRALRTQFVAEDVNLDPDFPFAEFKGLGSGSGQAVTLPLSLSKIPPPAGAIGSVSNHFLGSNGFGIAVSKEYVQKFFDATLDSLKASVASVAIPVDFFFFSTVYRASVTIISGPFWKPGEIEISGTIDLKTNSVAPNGSISFTQVLLLELDVSTQSVALKPKGDPQVTESSFIPHSRALNEVKKARDSALPAAGAPLNASFNDAKARLLKGLNSFDPVASVTYQALEVTPEGIIARGSIGTHWRRFDPVVNRSETGDGGSFTALQSWIPAGRIDEFEWTWQDGIFDIKSTTDSHRFTLPKPTASPGLLGAGVGNVCLRFRGIQTMPDGSEQQIDAGTTCEPVWSEPILVFPPYLIEIYMPLWLPRWPEGELLEQAIAAHINVAAQSRPPGALTTNSLIHFAGVGAERPLDSLGEALSQLRSQDVSLAVFLVLPPGSFGTRRNRGNHRGELEDMLGSLGESFTGQLQVTEDYRDGWTKLFAAGDGPATYLVNARGEYVWKRHGELEARELASGLDAHLLPAPAPKAVPLRMAVQTGEQAPDALFLHEQGTRTALRRLRGQRVLVNFWKSWSMPCLRELERLQRIYEQGGETAPVILAVNGGEDSPVLTEVRCQYHLGFPLIYDREQSIARLYGVQCWPTTVSINEDGTIDRIQFGFAYETRGQGPCGQE